MADFLNIEEEHRHTVSHGMLDVEYVQAESVCESGILTVTIQEDKELGRGRAEKVVREWLWQTGIVEENDVTGHWPIQLKGLNAVMMVAKLEESAPAHVRIGPKLELFCRLFRLARNLVEQRDVIGFAAPSHYSLQQAFFDCFFLQSAKDDQLPNWGLGNGTFTAKWIPAWSKDSARALRMFLIAQASRVLGEQVDCTALVESWLWQCVDEWTRYRLITVRDVAEERAEKVAYRVMYRGEADVREAFREALLQGTRSFSADAWLITRSLKSSFLLSGWNQEWLWERTGRAFYTLDFELLPPEEGSGFVDWRLRFRIAHRTFPVQARLEEWWKNEDREWRVGPDVLERPEEWILPLLKKAGELYRPIQEAMKQPNPTSCVVPVQNLLDLVTVVLPKFHEEGWTIHAPQFESNRHENVRVRVRVQRGRQMQQQGARRGPTERFFDTEELVNFDWSVVIDDQELNEEEFRKLVRDGVPVVELGGSWKLIPVEEILKKVESLGLSSSKSAPSFLDFSRTLLMTEAIPDESGIDLDVEYDNEAMQVERAVHAIKHVHEPSLLPSPALFQGSLRHYQQLGMSWLVQLRNLGLGACLADDMGLGKTIQVLAYMSAIKEADKEVGPHLLVCPTSLVQNWKSEFRKFTPNLLYYIHHGPHRNESRVEGIERLETEASEVDVVITTYATAMRDVLQLSQIAWDVVVVDEAQNIKNASTKQAKAVRKLGAFHRIALTGTPIENRLEELWSILQFVNPGFLGSVAWFRRTFADPISRDPRGGTAERLQVLLRPILLRRRKTDPSIQLELPEKWEVREYAQLSSEQAAMYQSVVNQLFSKLDTERTFGRRGQILAALVRLKQICDHPCLVGGGNSDPKRSGKLRMLLDLLEGSVVDGEHALIFTQFRDMGELLCQSIEERFGARPFFLHGGLTSTARGEIVDKFQSGNSPSPVLVLSLKAGGVGLNLTRANHVFHFDRWWNPAVEDQATDRVFRIGQHKDVQVHKLICSGTLEERIDALISSKRQLSQAIVGQSEGWVTELSDSELANLFQLDIDSAMEEEDVW